MAIKEGVVKVVEVAVKDKEEAAEPRVVKTRPQAQARETEAT